MFDAARFIKIEATAAAKSTALGRAAKRPYKSPHAACPTGWVRQAQTVIRLIKRPVCPVGAWAWIAVNSRI